jgi:hypothetical protein
MCNLRVPVLPHRDGGEGIAFSYGLSSLHRVVLQQSCKVKNLVNITLLRLLENPRSQLLWVMGHELSIQ